ncbi:MAG: hypothetical protein KAG98_04390 [Lentisphaeria bacterium]|nr:hypothetical protein [Lentisphaeria bacterium]
MKYIIGSQVIEVQTLPTHPLLKDFFRDPVADDCAIDCTVVFSSVPERNWETALPWHEGKVWHVGSETVKMDYDLDANLLELVLIEDPGPFTEYWLCRFFFAALGGISKQQLIHSSAVIKGGKGYVFSAASGVGKSTLFENIKDYVQQVNDETNWVYKKDGVFVLVNQRYYFGESDEASVPVEKVCILHRDEVCHYGPSLSKMSDFTILISVHPPFDNFDPFLEQRSQAILQLQNEFNVDYFYANRVPSELASALFV